MHVLIAEDDALHRTFARTIVEELWSGDLEVLEASDGEDAIGLAVRHSPSCVVLDLQLPKVTGIEVARAIWGRSAATRILFWSKRWEKPFVTRRVWQRASSFRIEERVSAPQLCTPTVDIKDMFFPNTPTYLLPGNPLPFPPPIPNGVTAQLEVVVPGYPNATAGLQIQLPNNTTFTPQLVALAPTPLGSVYRATFPSDLLGVTGTMSRARFIRVENVFGTTIRHLSDWRDIPRVGP